MPTKKYLHNIDLAQNELISAVLHKSATDPLNPVEGQVYFNTTSKAITVYRAGTGWQPVGGYTLISEANGEVTISGALTVTDTLLLDNGLRVSNGIEVLSSGIILRNNALIIKDQTFAQAGTIVANNTIGGLDINGTLNLTSLTAGGIVVADTNGTLSVITNNSSNWNTAYGWGNHASAGYQVTSQKGQPNGYASLDGSGLVPSTQLPSYVDDVLEYANLAAFPATGTTGKIYVALDTNETYRWSGSAYVRIANGAVQSVNGNTGIVTISLASLGGITLTSLSSTATGLTYTNTTGVFSLTSGYAIPTTASQTNWDSAFSERRQWDGGSTNLVAATGRTSLGATTVGSNLFTLTNPSTITFLRINADNSVSTLDAATFRTAIGAGTGSGTVTAVSVVTANGVSGSVTATSTPAITITLGAITPTSVNSVVISGSATPTLAVTGTSSISGSNTGDNAVNSLYSGLVSNATHTGDATGSTALTVVGLRGVALPTLGASAGFLRYTGTGTNTWVFDTATYLTTNQSITLSGDISGTGTTAITTAIGANKVTNAMLAQIPTATFHGRVTAATGNVENITGTQATTLLDVFTTTLKGLAPASGGGTTNFLRADGTWAAPNGTGGFANPMTTLGDIIYGGASGAATRLAGNTTSTKNVLLSTGSAGAATAPSWGTLTASDVGAQASSTNLTSLAGLTFASTSFVKMTSAGTFALDTNTYYLSSNPSGYTSNTGTVTQVTVTTANGVSGAIATQGTTPAITITLGAITPTSVNSVVISGASTPTLSVTGTSSISGSNTGDNAVNSLYSGLVSNATHTGDATGATALTVVGLRGVALPALGASAGNLRYTGTGTNTWIFDTATYLTTNQSITLSGDVSGTGTTAITTTLATITQSTGSSFVKITLDTKGRVTGNTTVAASDLNSTFGSQTANTVYAAPNGSAGNPSFRALVAADIPALSYQAPLSGSGVVKSTAGTISYISGTASQFIKGDGSLDSSTYLTTNQSITLSGDISGTGTTAITTTIGANKVTNAMLAQVATATFKGRTTASTGNVEDLTVTQATALLNVFTSTLKGLAPASGGGTTTFLRADGTWAAPGGTGGGTVTSVSVVSANGFAGSVATDTTTPAITLTTTITGLLKGNGTAISAATAGTDYVVPSALNSYLPLTGGTLSGTLTTGGTTIITATGGGSIEFYPTGGSNATYSVLRAKAGSGLAPTLAFYGDVSGTERGYGIYGADGTYDGLLIYRETGTVADVIFMGANQVSLPSTQKIAWASSANSVGTLDIGLSRYAANVLEVNNGSAGTPGSLRFLGATVTGLAGSGTRMVVADSSGVLSTQTIPSGSGGYTISTKTANYTETATSGTIVLKGDTSGGTFTITLPTAVGNTAMIIIKKTAGSAALVIDGAGSETIDGGLTATINKVYESITIVSDNTNWQIV